MTTIKVKYPKNFSKSRNKIIIEYCKNKKVLHIGACDSPATKKKYEGKEGPLLYTEIDKVAKDQLGIDIDRENINFLNSKKELKKSKIIYFDMNKLGELDYKPDIIVFGEIIEHLMNLEIALTNIKKIMDKDTLLIISTPNAFSLDSFIDSIFGFECFNSDHKVLFSYGYLKNLLSFNDLIIEKGFFTTLDTYKSKLNIFGKIRNILTYPLKKLLKFNSNTILLIVRLKK